MGSDLRDLVGDPWCSRFRGEFCRRGGHESGEAFTPETPVHARQSVLLSADAANRASSMAVGEKYAKVR